MLRHRAAAAPEIETRPERLLDHAADGEVGIGADVDGAVVELSAGALPDVAYVRVAREQEPFLFPMSIAENIFLANAPSKYGVIDRDARYIRKILSTVRITETLGRALLLHAHTRAGLGQVADQGRHHATACHVATG
mgnify:CR=1 FL=1